MASRKQKCRRWKGIRVHLDYRESGVAKKKRTVLHWISYLVLLSAIFFSTRTVSCVMPDEGQKGVVLFHMRLFFFLPT